VPGRYPVVLLFAANKGNVVAQNRMARLYHKGRGVERDFIEAAKWNILARARGLTNTELDELTTALSEGERGEAKRRAKLWEKQYGSPAKSNLSQ